MASDQALRASTSALASVLLDALSPFGLGLYDCELRGGRLVVTIDAAAGAVDLDRLAEVAKAVSARLDERDDLVGDEPYELEVTTPGLERALRLPSHFASAVTSSVALRLRTAVDGTRRFEGRLVSVSEDGVELECEDGRHTVSFSVIERAHTIFDWKAALAAKREEPSDASAAVGPVAAGPGRTSSKERR